MKSIFFLIASIFLSYTFAFATDEAPEKKIGVVLPLTGGGSYQAQAVRKGVELAMFELEKKGTPIEVLFEDDQTNPSKTVSAIQSLHARGCFYLVGPLWSFQINASRSLIEAKGMIALAPASSSDINGSASKSVFNLTPPRGNQLPIVKDWLYKKGFRKALLLTPIGDWGEVHRDIFRKAVQETGGRVVADEQFNYGIDSATAQTALLKHSKKEIEVIFVTGTPDDVAVFVKARKQLGLSWPVLATEDLPDALALGLISIGHIAEEFYAVGLKVEQSFKDKYFSHYKEQPKLYADRGYEAVMKLEDAFSTSTSAKEVSKKLKPLFDENNDAKWGEYWIRQVGKK